MHEQDALRLRQLGRDAMFQGRFEEALAHYDEALALAETAETRELITINKAEALIALDREGAEVTALPAIVMRRRSPRHVYMAAAVLMRRFNEAEDRKRALFYGEIARDAAAELGDAFARANVLNTIGIIQTVESRFTDAAQSFDQSLMALREIEGRESDVAFAQTGIIANLGGAKILSGSYMEGIYLVSEILERLADDYSRTEALLDLCFGYLELEEYDEAERLGRQALQLASVRRQVRNANHLLGEIMVRTDRYDEADTFFTAVAGFYPEYQNVKELLFTVDLCAVVNWKG